MRSIRWSLVLYFLLLMGAALSAVSYFSYQSTQSALEAKEISTKELLTKKFKEEKVAINSQFDAKIYERARALGQKVVLNYHRIESLNILGVITNVPHSGAMWNLLPWAEATQPLFLRKGGQTNIDPRLQIDPRIQAVHADDEHVNPVVEEGEFFQTYFRLSDVLPGKGGFARKGDFIPHESSETLGSLVWQLSGEQRDKAENNARPYDDVKLKSGQKVRRVTIRVPVNWQRVGVNIPPIKETEFMPFRGGLQWNTKENIPLAPNLRPFIYLQYGLDTAELDKSVAKSKAELDQRLDELSDDLAQARYQLGRQLLWVSLGAFAALVVGGLFLVGVGLSPLDRLSEAVSKVSEKDFRLPIDQDHLPRELKPIADRLSQTLDQLKRVFEREKQAAADISHELRTPVAALLTTLDITLRKPRQADEYREVLEECRNSGKQINQLVERLLTLARLNAGADLLRPREVDVNALTDQCVALVRPLAEARGLKLNVRHNGPASVNADPDKLREVLTNLLHNAIEYNKTDGSIDVQVARNNGTLELEVRDTGIGISPDAQHRIFERFYRADQSRHSDETPHAGLGLAIVKGYVDLMGGSIAVDSTVGAGSTFRVRLPGV